MLLYLAAEQLTWTAEAVRGLAVASPAWIASKVKGKQAQVAEVLLENSSHSQKHSVLRALQPID